MKTVLITGITMGIGEAAARAFLAEGYTVFGCARHISDHAADLRAAGAVILQADVSNEPDVERLFTTVFDQTDHVDVIVNNAGIWKGGLLQDMTLEDFEALVNVNLKGTFLVTKKALPSMIARREGSIINVSSMWGLNGASCESLYSMTKGGINALTQALAKELAPSNIRVNAVAPGAIDTRMNAVYSPKERSAMEDSIGLGRFGRPEEVADLILFLASEKASYITGEIIKIDGAF